MTSPHVLAWSSHVPFPDWAPGYPHAAETAIVLPASDELYLLSRGSYQHGKLRVKQHGHDVTVAVRMAYHDAPALARATLCRLRNRNGLGIYTPTESHGERDRLLCDIVITLPTPARFAALTLLTSNIGYEISDMWRTLCVDTLDLAASNAPIRVAGITVHRGTIVSSNGPITGHFNARALTLATSNAAIHASVSLFSAGSTATLDMHTSNGPIKSALALVADGTASFAVQAHSSNGPVELRYDDLSARLVSEVHTSNALATVVAPAFEGTFDVSTSNGRAVVRDLRAVDPTGAGRPRVVDQETATNRASGRAAWGSTAGGGRCVVHTSNAGASLAL